MLYFNPAWRFTSPGPLSRDAQNEFFQLIKKVSAQLANKQWVLEEYKTNFAAAAGRPSYTSSGLGWAETDLQDYMQQAGENAATFIEAFYDTGVSINQTHTHVIVPDAMLINDILGRNSTGYQLQPPNLISNAQHPAVQIAERPPSLDEEAWHLVQTSLKQSAGYLAAGNGRQAVQEIMWLLETVSTAFEGLSVGNSTVEGKYFNKIADQLRLHQRGTTAEQALTWMKSLHGYLSSPTGGAVRHGGTLTGGAMPIHEAKLFCNLTRSYLYFLIDEYTRLQGKQ